MVLPTERSIIMEYVTFARYTDNDQELNCTAAGEGVTNPDVPLLEENDSALLQPSGNSPRILTAHPPVTRKYSLTTISLIILCTFLAVGLVVVTLKYTTSKRNTENSKNKRDTLALKHFIQISDTHLDIYYDSDVTNKNFQGCRKVHNRGSNSTIIVKSDSTAVFGRIKCDSPLFLLESLKKQLAKVNNELESGAEFILLTGDQVAHAYQFFDVNLLDSVLWSIANSTKVIADALPGIPIFMAIGNNDLKIDYDPPVKNYSAFYRSLYNIFEPYVFPKGSDVALFNSKETFRETFEQGGYYSIVLNGGKLLLVVLNTDYWSMKAYLRNKNVTVIGDIQMKWLHEQLDAANSTKQKVILAGHIPPGIDAYNGKSLWKSNYLNSYTFMTTFTFRHVISVQLYGHIHQDKIKVQYHGDKYFDGEDKSFLLTCPSVTPVYGSNPAFRVYDYDNKRQSLQDYTQYYLDLAASNVNKKGFWFKEYSFRDTYDVELTMQGVEDIMKNLLEPSSSTWTHYLQHMKAKMGGVPYYKRYAEYCATRHFTDDEYTNCLKKYKNIGV